MVTNFSSEVPSGFLALQNLVKSSKEGQLSKLSSDLSELFTGVDPLNSQVNSSSLKPESSLQVIGSSVAIEAVADTDSAQLLSDLKALGLQQSSVFGRVISGVIPIDALDEVAALSSLRFVRPAYKPIINQLNEIDTTTPEPIANVGSVTSQGDQAQRSDIARTTYGVNGAGITVGVLSDSYNNLGGAASDVASGDLPSGVIVLQDLPSGGSDEGRAMLQIVHDVAPGAKLAFNTAWLGGTVGFANGILNLAKPVASGGAGAKVIVDDVGYAQEPFFQDGIVTQAVDQVASNGVAYFSSASNYARQSYESAFTPGQTIGVLTYHDFDPSGAVNIFQKITLNNGVFTPALQWDQPFASASTTGAGSQNDLDMFLYADSNGDGTPDQLIASSIDNNVGGDPFEFCNIQGTGTAYLAIAKYNPAGGPNPSKIKYVDFTKSHTTIYQFATNSSTSFGHNQSANGQGVAAAYYQKTPAFGTNPPVAEPFTSLGGTRILFDKAGNRLATPIIRNQPAITAPDGVVTTLPSSSGLNPFFGTSAAAPHAAGAAALIRQTVPSATNTQIYNALKSTAVDMNTPGYDFLTGTGLIRADAAIASLCINGTAGNDNLTGTANADVMNGFAGNDTLSGLAGNDILNGGTENDSLNGGLGADQLKGGAGNDIYVVDNTGDVVTELASGGTDLIQSSVTYTLPGEVENLTLTGITAINGTGNTVANIITGNTANNTLNGSTGADQLKGGTGNDTYVVDNTGDVVTELASGGTDLIQSSVTYTLPVEVENLTLTGTTAINGTGNTVANIITGNTANNTLSGGAANDTLTGGLGADSFIYNTSAAFATSAVGVDTITDFTIGQGDKIVLDKTTFTSISSIPGTGFSVASEFAKVTTDALAATSAADIVYNTATGGLFYNQNGIAAGFGNGGQFLTLTNKPVLTASQFLIQT
ncbi:S8 family serine peptidase [Planktothrix agardhii]|uniref:S8 family serine peptidase n=1 Tax=Planktothrix agardhii TaxID=1160 RepID=UPI001D0A8132|nr:S8 family serine peptidase [Planktothrix agardhii]MCB8761497.1 S8 family serine peptidase [Planktothrix agardhii 1813]